MKASSFASSIPVAPMRLQSVETAAEIWPSPRQPDHTPHERVNHSSVPTSRNAHTTTTMFPGADELSTQPDRPPAPESTTLHPRFAAPRRWRVAPVFRRDRASCARALSRLGAAKPDDFYGDAVMTLRVPAA